MSFQSVSFGLQKDDVVGFTSEQRTAIELHAAFSVVSEGYAVFKNFKYPRTKNFFGYALLMDGAFVKKEIPLNFINQELLHWRDDSFGVIDTIGCYFKLFAGFYTPPQTITPIIVKTRQPYTSIRFKLGEGVRANMELKWEIGESSCGSEIQEPGNDQGNPPSPNNQGWNPGSRPSGQTGDPLDNSPNDNQPKKPGQNDPPTTNPTGQGTGTWKETVTWADGYSQVYPLSDSNINSNYQAVGNCYEGTQGASEPGTGKHGLSIYRNGVYIGCAEDISHHGSTVSVTFDYS